MCGRFAIDIEKPVFERRFNVHQLTIKLEPHYNVSPGMFLPTVIRQSPNRAALMKWGLIPHWSREFRVKFSNINARSESIESSPAYRDPFRRKRCLIPAIGFYEWAKLTDGTKWPYFFRLNKRDLFAFAGIWDTWTDAEGKEFHTCAIITCPANSVVAKIHPRMPVILRERDEEMWLSDTDDVAILKAMLLPYNASDMTGHRVALRVNNPQNDDAHLVDVDKESPI